jgi:hypothetical protein
LACVLVYTKFNGCFMSQIIFHDVNIFCPFSIV